MKITEDQKEQFERMIARNESPAVHELYDKIVKERLEQLDPELLSELDNLTRDVPFWYE